MPIQTSNSPFVAAYHRESWMVRTDGRVVPLLIQIPMTPGVNGIGERQRQSPLGMWETIQAQSKGRGRLLLHPNWTPADHGPAVIGTQCRDPHLRGRVGTRWHMAWESPRVGTTVIDVDLAAWDAYLDEWATHGVPERPDSDVIDARVDELARRLDRTLARSDGRETARAKAVRRELDAWVKLTVAAEAGPEAVAATAAPKKTPKPKVKSDAVSLEEPAAESPRDGEGNGFG